MWQNFYIQSTNIANVIEAFHQVKQDVFENESIRVKEHFARRVSLAFDNLMIFHAKNGLEENLISAMSKSQIEMNSASPLFPQIRMYLLKEDKGYSLLLNGLEFSEDLEGLMSASNFEYMGQQDGIIENFVKFENDSISTLVFDLSLVNYSRSWINFLPAMEDRAKMQADHILFVMTFKKIQSSITERLQFMENVRKHPNYAELYAKIIRLMPKMESSLEKQWRVSSVKQSTLKIQ